MINNVRKCVMTKGIANEIDNGTITIHEIERSISKFLNEDWGNICEEDKLANANDINDIYCMLLGSYEINKHDIWIVANAIDESSRVITVLFPSEY